MPHAVVLLIALALAAPAALAQAVGHEAAALQTASRPSPDVSREALESAARDLPGATPDAIAGYAHSVVAALDAPDRATRQLAIHSARSRLSASLPEPLSEADAERLDDALGLPTEGY